MNSTLGSVVPLAMFCFYICSEMKNYCCPWHTQTLLSIIILIYWAVLDNQGGLGDPGGPGKGESIGKGKGVPCVPGDLRGQVGRGD